MNDLKTFFSDFLKQQCPKEHSLENTYPNRSFDKNRLQSVNANNVLKKAVELLNNKHSNFNSYENENSHNNYEDNDLKTVINHSKRL